MKQDIVDYVINNYGYLKTKEETVAWYHYFTIIELEKNKKVSDLEDIKNIYITRGRMTKDPKIIQLLENGIEGLKIRITKRILDGGHIRINYCPVCKKATRTPRAKQCRFCRHDWH